MRSIRPVLLNYLRDSYLKKGAAAPISSVPSSASSIDCEVGHSPFGASPQMLQQLSAMDWRAVDRYPEMFYDQTLKPAIQEKFLAAQLAPESIFFGHGSFNLAERIIHKFVTPLAMLGYGPQFNEIPSEMVATGAAYCPEPLTQNYEFPFSVLLEESRSKKYSLVYLDNPNNPTGMLIPLDQIAEICHQAESSETLVLVDEAYGDYVEDGYSAINLVHRFNNLMVIRSFSKALGLAAQRIGYLVLSDQLFKLYGEIDVPFEPTLISAEMARLTLMDKTFIASIRTRSANIKAQIREVLESRGLIVLPTHPAVSIMTIHNPGHNLFAEFSHLGIKVENGLAYERTCPFMNSSYVRLRVPNEEALPQLIDRLAKHDFRSL